MRISFRAVVLTAVLLVPIGAAGNGVPGPDQLGVAAAQLRDRNYAAAVRLGQEAGDSPQRSMLLGVALLRDGKTEAALPLLAAAEAGLPLAADYAVLYQAEGLLKLGRHQQAAAKVAAFAKQFPASLLIRRAEKLYGDILYGAGDYPAARRRYQEFVEKYPSGGDSVEALYQVGRCRDATGDPTGAALVYRTVWLNNPATPQAKQAEDRLGELEKKGVKPADYTAEELLRRASTLTSQNEYSAALKTLRSIPLNGQKPEVALRVELRTGVNLYRLRNWQQAEKSLARVAGGALPGVRSEARFWLAKSLERQEQNERALAMYLELADEGKKQEYADNALMEAGGLQRGQGRYGEAARLYERIIKEYPATKFAARAAWEAGWCRYLAGEYGAAVESFAALLQDDASREKALYWTARALERIDQIQAEGWFRLLQEEYPSGFYATWHRTQTGAADTREGLDKADVLGELPLLSGFDKPRQLAALGLMEEARGEIAAARRKSDEKKGLFPGLARLYLEMQDYGAAISLFLQNRPVKWDRASLPLWTAGYPRVFAGDIARYAGSNGLSEGLVFALVRAESRFSPAVKSPAGAIGLMQLMPATAKMTLREKGEFDPARLVVPEFNIRVGTRHLGDLLKQYNGETVFAVAAYNAGASAVERWRKSFKGRALDEFVESIPYQETREYVKKVYASAATYRRLYGLK